MPLSSQEGQIDGLDKWKEDVGMQSLITWRGDEQTEEHCWVSLCEVCYLLV